MTTREVLQGMDDDSLRAHVRDLVYNSPDYQPLLSFSLQLKEQAGNSGNQLRLKVGLAVMDILREIQEQIDQGSSISSHMYDVGSLSFLVPVLSDELHQIPDALKVIMNVAVDLVEVGAYTEESGWGNLMLQALTYVQREGDNAEVWQQLWNRDDRPDVWTYSLIGLAKSDIGQAVQQLAKVAERAYLPVPEEAQWNPGSAVEAIEAIAYKTPFDRHKYFRQYTSIVSGLAGQPGFFADRRKNFTEHGLSNFIG